ncbi:protein virilizer homolog [Cornus florida]|uniref:protein virilizer homolog n=1 Tax=Cornus florida TaxID=4283 RepID=UPI00289D0D30|nr:protein virilizer homolog [Cornus florida]
MGRTEPCVLFAQTFVHPQLDEYVDEVIFAEPIVITACEFLEQNASSASPAVTLIGATSPPSFALEVFVQCEGETRFKRLCQPFLYSHSSSNVLEVEAVVTSHLVVRGSYRSLTLVIYGNTAEDLGQFNFEIDLDSSLTNIVRSIEEKLEDLPSVLLPAKFTIEESISPLKTLSLDAVALDISVEIKQFLLLTFKILELSNLGDAINKVVSSVVSAASSYATESLQCRGISEKQITEGRSRNCEVDSYYVFPEARKELLEICKSLQHESGKSLAEFLAESMVLESEADLATSKQLVDILSQYFPFNKNSGKVGHPLLSQNKNVILWLSLALVLCSGRESCFHFVNDGGMEQLGYIFCHGTENSSAVTLMLLGVVEQATRHSIGCEGFLGWWPREDENVPSGISEGYNQLLKLLLRKQRHDVASLATYVLHRLRLYEVASKYECAVLSVLGGLSAAGRITSVTLDMLNSAKLQLKKLLKLINMRGPIEDPSSLASWRRSFILGGTEGLLSYKATSSFITSSNCCFSNWDIDSHLLSLLKERGFLPLSAALLSSSILRSEVGHVTDMLVEVASYIEAIILSLLFCRSGLIFLLLQPELSTTVILSLKGADDLKKEESVPLPYAFVLISKGFFCRPWEVGMIIETHLRVVNAVDRLLTSTCYSEEILWVLWELCRLSRSDCGRQALLALGHFPEAISVLMEAFHSFKDLDPVSLNSGAPPLNLAIFHSAAEIFEVIVTDSTASSLGSWIEHAAELHKALHSSSPGSNRKDAPTRLLDWIDAGVVYHRNGAIGLLRYSAVLASGGDAHMASTSILASDTMDVENVVGDSSNSDSNVIENLLGKPISDKDFHGVALRDSSVAQLTTAFRILAFISENVAVADALYDEGAILVIHAVLIDCRFMFERSSNNYDYLVDEGTEGNSTSDLLLERYREQSLVDLLIPSLVLLITLLQRLQETKEQHKDTKLMNSLLRLHREVSPKLAACAADLSSSYPNSALGFEAVCNLTVSALSCWPLYGWVPGLFLFILDSLHATSLLTLGPKETCSLLCLLNDLFPEEGVWLWKNGMPMLSALRTLAVGTLLGPQKERQINWYLQPGHCETLLKQLKPQLDKIAQIILHYATSTLVVIQDMLRVLIVRIACQNAGSASTLLRPIILWIRDCLLESSSLADTDAYKVYRLLDFVAILLEHPLAKPLLLKEHAVQMLTEVLEGCISAIYSDGKQFQESRNATKYGFSQLCWCIPVFKSLLLICDSGTSVPYPGTYDSYRKLTTEDCSLILSCLLKLCKVLPVGEELLDCLSVFKELVCCNEGQSALMSIFLHIQSSGVEEFESESRHEKDGKYSLLNEFEWRKHPPLLCCWTNLLSYIDSKDVPPLFAIEAVGVLSSGALLFCMDGKSLNPERVDAVKYLFGLPCDMSSAEGFHEENMKCIQELTTLLSPKLNDEEFSSVADIKTTLHHVMESAKSLSFLLQKPTGSVEADDIIDNVIPRSSGNVPASSKIRNISDGIAEKAEDYNFSGLGDKFLWECPENLRDRLSQAVLPVKRKISSLEGPNRRKGDNAPAETTAQSAFSRGSPSAAPSGPTRRDTFRQRKPNTSRPPSMHVDDYVARERNVDGTSSSNVIAVPRVGSTSGRPPSIHVDEFMARQRERQNPMGMSVGDAAAQIKIAPPDSERDAEKSNKSRQLKPDPDDDLQGIDIVFEGEESESDDKLPFPQPDDNPLQPSPVIVEQSSPHSIVEETESDVNESSQFSHLGTPLASNVDENTQNEFSSRMSVSRPEMPLTREPSISSDKKYHEQSDDINNVPIKTSRGFDSGAAASSSGFPGMVYNKASTSSVPVDSRMPPHNFYLKHGLQQIGAVPLSTRSQGLYDQKFPLNQPPLPPMPPPPTIASLHSQTLDPLPSQSSQFVNSITDVQPPLPTGFHVQTEYLSVLSNSTSVPSSSLMPARTSMSSPGGSARPPPPLPPLAPPYSTTPSLTSLRTSASQSSVYNQTSIGTAELGQTSVASLNDVRFGNLSASGSLVTSYPPPPLAPPSLFSRPTSMPISLYASSPTPHQGENPPSISQNLPIPLPSFQSVQSLAQLQPLQPPQLPRPPQPPQHLRPPIPASSPSEQVVSMLQNPVQLQVQPLQMLQQPQVSPIHVFYQHQQQENFSHLQQQLQVEHANPQVLHQHADGASRQQEDSGMSLQHYFSSPEAIQSLLSDRDQLCLLLEQHPRLMQMLQERLGHL